MRVVHVAARAVQIFCREDTVAREVVEYVAEDIGAALVLVGGVISVAHVHTYGRISARNEEFRGYDVDLSRGLPAPHRHGLYLLGIHRVGGEVQTAAREILNIWRYALAIYAVEEEGEVGAGLDAAAGLHAPSEETRVFIGDGVVQIHVPQHGRCAEVARAVLSPCILEIHGYVGYALRYGTEVLVIGATHDGHLGRYAHLEVAVVERMFVSQHRGEVEVIGVGALEVYCRGRGVQIAEGRDVSTRGESQQRDVCRTQTGRIAELGTAAEVHVDEGYDGTYGRGVDHRLGEQTRGGGIHHHALAVGVVGIEGYVVGDEVDIVDGAHEVIARAKVDVTADTE